MSTIALLPKVDATFAEHVVRRRPLRFTHGMVDHPMLQLDAVADLADQLPPEQVSAELASKPLVSDDPHANALDAGSLPQSVAQQIRDIAASDSWFTLLHVERQAAYRRLVNEVIDGVADRAGLPRADLAHRMGFVFASSPGSVTSAHVDVENSLLMQLRGRRTLSFGRFDDDAHRDEEVRRYWAGRYGRLDRLPALLETHDLEPGVGAFIPPWTPHWITNGDELSLSLTVTFFTPASARETRVQAFNHSVDKAAGRLGVRTRPYGASPGRDGAKALAMRAVHGLKRLRDPSASPFG